MHLNFIELGTSFVLVSDLCISTFRKDVRLPQQLQRAMAAEAEAAREARAKVIAAEGEHKSSRALAHAAEVIAQSPAALQVKHSNISSSAGKSNTYLRILMVN